MCLVYLEVYEQTVAIKERFYLASFIQLETQADNIGVRSGVRPQLHRPRRRVRMSVVSAPNALLARRTAAPRAGVRAARSTSVVRCDASKGAESNNPRASLGRRDVFGAVAAGVALLSSSQPASALQPGDIGYLKAQREAAANAPPAPEPEPEPAAAPAPAKKTAKAKPAPKPKAPPKPKPTPKAKAAPAPKAAPTPPPPAPPPAPTPPPATRAHATTRGIQGGNQIIQATHRRRLRRRRRCHRHNTTPLHHVQQRVLRGRVNEEGAHETDGIRRIRRQSQRGFRSEMDRRMERFGRRHVRG